MTSPSGVPHGDADTPVPGSRRVGSPGGSATTAQPVGAPPDVRSGPDGPTDAAGYRTVQSSDDFQELRRRFRTFVWPATVVFLSWYLLYVILSGWARGFMGVDLIGNINVAYVFGLLQFVSTFLIAWLYSRYADRKLDPQSQQIADEFRLNQEVPR